MSPHSNHYTNILRFWRSVETFTMPDLGRIGPDSRTRSDSSTRDLRPGDPLPWEQPGHRTDQPKLGEQPGLPPHPGELPGLPPPAAGRRWRHTLYFHVIKKEDIITLLARYTNSGEYREPIGGYSCLSALVVDQNGAPGLRTYSPAAFIHAIKLIRKNHDPEELSESLRAAQEEYLSRFDLKGLEPGEDPAPVTWKHLEKELEHLRRLAPKELHVETAICCVSEEVAPTTTLDAPFLNSYYIHDLDTLIRHPQNIGEPLERLLTPHIDIDARQNLLEPRVLLEALHPRHLSPGRWPANPAHGLFSAQLAALNCSLSTLRTQSGLIGINGPPGTGKTTLLREVIADIVVTRAKRLLAAGADNLFSDHRISITDRSHYHPLSTAVFGNDGIVVASNNNTAIENISRELPQIKSIDIDSFPEAEYFSLPATNIYGQPSWGLLSAVLGRSENRSTFIDKFWFKKGSFGKFLREQYEDTTQATAHYKAVAVELKRLLGECEKFQNLACKYHDALLAGEPRSDHADPPNAIATLAERLTTEFDIPTANLPAPGFLDRPMHELHRLTPYSSEKVNALRSQIFLLSLELHEWAIRANASYFHTNLGTFVDMLSGKHREQIDESVATILWNTFFFCIPVVSVTLASFSAQFSRLTAGAIGWLLLDEAGQATLPSVCGAIWRSRRNILIGDTRQIAPVVTIPEALGELLQRHYQLDDTWSPIQHSAQWLADRVTNIGTWLENPADPGTQPPDDRPGPADPGPASHTVPAGSGPVAPTWTGLPLRAHRRCDEPMFSIANTIAYNNQMVRVPGERPADAPIPSAWIDVTGQIFDNHTVAEELDAVGLLLQQLTNHIGKIFIISPFRSIAHACRERFKQPGKIECGTIHTFQGREAPMVILVLGTAPHGKKARNWVSATPNILNVAITRARHRLYVIGNRRIWRTHPYFDQLAKSLPLNPPMG